METLLSLYRVSRRYRDLLAVAEVDLQVADGARHAVIGPNGAGKSTLLHLIAGTVRPSGGRVHFAARDLTTVGAARRARSGICRTFQTPAVWDSLSALDNVVLGAWRRWPGRYRQLAIRGRHLLERLGLAAEADTVAGALSHGQRRLLEIGVALAGRPRLLLLDEPAAGLTDEDLPRLLDCLRDLPAHVAVLLVEHHLDLVSAVAETVTVLHHGRVVATGSPNQVMTDPAVVEAYLGSAHTDREG